MTAINPARLKIQAASLGQLLGSPQELIPSLHDLLTFYSGRIRQTSLSKTPLSLQSYQTPPPVLRAIENEITEHLQGSPETCLQLADALWRERWVETRSLAIFALGCLPADQAEPVLARLREWLEDCTAEETRRQLMTRGLRGIASQRPDLCLDFIQELISSGSHQAGAFGLDLYASDPGFTNLPLLYRYLGQILQAEGSGFVKEISGVLRKMAARSEQETVYFLIRQLEEASKPRIIRVVRSIISEFSADNQGLLRLELAKYK